MYDRTSWPIQDLWYPKVFSAQNLECWNLVQIVVKIHCFWTETKISPKLPICIKCWHWLMPIQIFRNFRDHLIYNIRKQMNGAVSDPSRWDNIFVTHVKWQRILQQNSRSAHPHLDNSGEILDFETKMRQRGGWHRAGRLSKDYPHRLLKPSLEFEIHAKLACQDFKPHWELPATLVLGGRARLPEKIEGDEENIDVSRSPRGEFGELLLAVAGGSAGDEGLCLRRSPNRFKEFFSSKIWWFETILSEMLNRHLSNNSKITVTRRSNVTLLRRVTRRVTVISPNFTKIARFYPKKKNSITIFLAFRYRRPRINTGSCLLPESPMAIGR